MMRAIYEDASDVLVWLGGFEGEKRLRMELIIEFIQMRAMG
jgi:hypothetical protein